MNIKKDILWRVIVSIGFIVLLAVAIIWNIIKIQFVQGEKWINLSDSLTVRLVEIPATRGSIFSDDGNVLATSIPQYSIHLDFSVIKAYHQDSFKRNIPILSMAFSQILGNKSEEEYLSLFSKNYKKGSRYVTIKRKASFLEVNALKDLPIFHHNRYKSGMILEERTIRKKPYNSLAFRTVGFINENKKGAGIELTFNESLEGDSGKMLVQKIPGGYKPLNEEAEIEPHNGKDIYTTIDIAAQDVVHNALEVGLTKNNAKFGCALVMDVKTGAIKAIANLALNDKEEYTEQYNYALGRLYEPGSTVKLMSALALLEEKKVKLDQLVTINKGKFTYYDRTYTDDHAWAENEIPFRSVIEKSSNAGTTNLIASHFAKDPKDYFQYFDKLLVEPNLQTKIKGGKKPVLIKPNSSSWTPNTLTSSSIGYSLELTPLQILSFYNAIGNNGMMMKPYLVEGVGSMGNIEDQFKPEVLHKSIGKESTIKDLQSMLEGVVLRGTAKNLKSLPFPVAGKTGTAKIADGDQGYIEGAYNSTFVGYFPADNPMYSCIVWVSWPQSGRYSGASVAAPIFKEIASKLFAQKVVLAVDSIESASDKVAFSGYAKHYQRIAKTYDLDLEIPKKTKWVKGHKDSTNLIGEEFLIQEKITPNFYGMGLRDALYYAEKNGIDLRFRGYGKIVEQNQKAGEAMRSKVLYVRLSTSN